MKTIGIIMRKCHTMVVYMVYTSLLYGCARSSVLRINEYDIEYKLRDEVRRIDKDNKEHRKIIGALVPAIHSGFITLKNHIGRYNESVGYWLKRAGGCCCCAVGYLLFRDYMSASQVSNIEGKVYGIEGEVYGIKGDMHNMQDRMGILEANVHDMRTLCSAALNQPTESSCWIPYVSFSYCLPVSLLALGAFGGFCYLCSGYKNSTTDTMKSNNESFDDSDTESDASFKPVRAYEAKSRLDVSSNSSTASFNPVRPSEARSRLDVSSNSSTASFNPVRPSEARSRLEVISNSSTDDFNPVRASEARSRLDVISNSPTCIPKERIFRKYDMNLSSKPKKQSTLIRYTKQKEVYYGDGTYTEQKEVRCYSYGNTNPTLAKREVAQERAVLRLRVRTNNL